MPASPEIGAINYKRGGSILTLYHSPQTRSGSIVWLLKELAVPYQSRIVEFRRADGTGARDASNPRPHDTVFEGGAIALFLADKYWGKRLGPAPGEPKRGEVLPGSRTASGS